MIQKVLIGAGIVAALIAALVFSGRLPGGAASKQTATGDVIVWGVFPESDMGTILQAFNAQAKTYRINYKYVSPNEIEYKLVEALASGIGPDAILAPYQVILSQQARVYPVRLSSVPEKMYKETFLDGTSLLWTPFGALGLPVAIEPMVLFYNRTLFAKHGVLSPPTYWSDVIRITPSLTVMNQNSTFAESSIALGVYTVPYMKDILMTEVYQQGQIPVLVQYNTNGTISYNITANDELVEGSGILPLESATRFITSFGDPLQSVYSWNQTSGNATDAFVAGKLAMYIGYSGELPVLRDRNPKLDIDMTYFPQINGAGTFVTGMRLYGVAVMRQSKNPTAAFTVASLFAGSLWSPQLATVVGASPAYRAYLTTPGLSEIVQKSLLVAKGWHDIDATKTDGYTLTMLADIAAGKVGVVDTVNTFVSRMTDLYTRR